MIVCGCDAVMQVCNLINLFIDHSHYTRGYSKTTLIRYRTILRTYCASQGISSADQVTEHSVRSFFHRGRTELGWTTGTFHVYHGTLLVFFQWCMKNGYLKNNPAEDFELPKKEWRIRTKLTKQQATRLLEVAYNMPYRDSFTRARNHAILATFLYTGLRKSELLNLRFTDIDLENLTLFVSQGKGAKDRIMPISHTLAHSLSRYIEERRKANRVCPEFFASQSRQRGISFSTFNRFIEAVKEASGVDFTAHKLRHTFATLMLEGGCDIYSLSKMMGHSDIKTTTIYLAATAEHLRSQMTKHPLNMTVPDHSAGNLESYRTLERFNGARV